MLDTWELTSLILAAAAGVLLGGFYFGGLWWTLHRLPRAAHPLNLYFGSLIVRLVVIMAAFCGVLTFCGWLQLAVAMAGLVAIRFVLIRVLEHGCTEVLQQEAV